jgi:3,4-dihydroxy 2-butanone 4-phosphate synthase / GTP cyclohydrolase II
MDMKSYLEKSNLTDGEFARLAGLSRVMVNRLKNGSVWPSKETAEKIVAASNGEITPNDFLACAPPQSGSVQS